jgi:hypothetical protein
MNAADVVGYAFDGELYCLDCVPQAKATGCTCGKRDRAGACESNCHGYGPNPVFACDAQDGDSCGSCGGYLDGCEPEEEESEEGADAE